MGVISPVGNNRRDFFSSLAAGRSGIRPVDRELAQRLEIGIAGQVAGFDPAEHFDRKRIPQLDRFSQLALLAAREAWGEAALGDGGANGTCGVYFGTCIGGAAAVELGYRDLLSAGANRVRTMTVLAAMPNAAAANIAMELGILGPTLTYSVACASSAVAIGEAYRAIASGSLDAAIAGGSEAMLVFGVMKGWEALMALAVPDDTAPETSCRPFDRDRTGLVLAEGAAAIVLEDLEHARARGANVIAEIVGYGLANDGSHLSKPDAAGQERAMRFALDEAARRGVPRCDIGYLNAHGTATRIGDKVETESIRAVFGDAAPRLPISSTKSLHGHLMGAAGAAELVAAIMAMERKTIPPTAHLYSPDPECDLDYVPNEARSAPDLRAVMSNSFAFGGANAVLVAARR